MRMKEVCARTGLTDRAVRLYIDSGLIAPERVSSYTGRSAIHFSEADVAVLEVVATLRQAGFAIADIKSMMETPEVIPDRIAARRAALADEIAEKEAVLAVLGRLGDAPIADCAALAAHLRASAPEKSVPKEDSGMSFKEIKRVVRGRIPSLVALAAAAVGLGNLLSVTKRAAFADITVKAGGGYQLDYRMVHSPGFVLFAYLPVILLTAAAVLLIVRVAGGRRGWLIAAMACCAASAVVLLIPGEVAERRYLFEFMDYRYSVLYQLIYSPSESFDIFIKSLKVIPHGAALALCAVGLWREKELREGDARFA
ncbi:MAG: MerR family transcriptional regulator [Clostridia bacterium]|nr:MerR family transcriptional regulator [Clostridia bacterium]